MTRKFGAQSTIGRIRRVILKRPEQAFRNERAIETEWRKLGFTGAPDLNRASSEHRELVSLLGDAEVLYLPESEGTTLDSLYTQDTAIIIDAGAIVFQTGKEARRGEGPAIAKSLREWNIPVIAEIGGAGTAEGGDLMFLDSHTLLAGRGFRTNSEGIEQLSRVLSNYDIRVLPFDLPYSNGADDCLHLMSLISLLDTDLAVVYRPMLPVPLFQLLQRRNVRLIDVPNEEYPTGGVNVLAVAPRDVLMLKGNPVTRDRLQAAGCRVREFEGKEISWKGCGGPTCLTKVVLREYGAS
jgi:N-dimethylarginine dimethylaminohydrolase